MTTALTLAIWAAALVAFVYLAWYGKEPVAGLAIGYWLNLAAMHVPSEALCFVYLNTSRYRAASFEGFPLTAWAVLGLMAGNLLLARPLNRLLRGARPAASLRPAEAVLLAQIAIVVGLILFLAATRLELPSVTAVVGSGNLLAAGGFAWWWWVSYRGGRHGQAWGILAGSLIIPLLILVFHGFLSFGIFALFTLAAFVVTRFRPRAAVLLASPVLLYLGLSAGVTYLNGRDDIRESVWYEQAETSERARVIETVFREGWIWFDPFDERQRWFLDNRFNQNGFLGYAAQRIDSGQMDYARGETITEAALSLIPRIVWRDKPDYVGGSEQMSRFTGERFAPGTTVGLGHVLEAYVNFGIPGLVICFTILGAVIGLFDLRAGKHLRDGRVTGFLMWFVPGQVLLNGGVGNFAALTGGMAGAFVLTLVYLRVFRAAAEVSRARSAAGRP
jgi:hypothetical protein